MLLILFRKKVVNALCVGERKKRRDCEGVGELAREKIGRRNRLPHPGNTVLEVVAQAVSPAIPDSFTASVVAYSCRREIRDPVVLVPRYLPDSY
jgi:hypothetical protein